MLQARCVIEHFLQYFPPGEHVTDAVVGDTISIAFREFYMICFVICISMVYEIVQIFNVQTALPPAGQDFQSRYRPLYNRICIIKKCITKCAT